MKRQYYRFTDMPVVVLDASHGPSTGRDLKQKGSVKVNRLIVPRTGPLSHPLVGRYPSFVGARTRLNTVLASASDLSDAACQSVRRRQGFGQLGGDAVAARQPLGRQVAHPHRPGVVRPHEHFQALLTHPWVPEQTVREHTPPPF